MVLVIVELVQTLFGREGFLIIVKNIQEPESKVLKY
jgi:hypothetical protein